MEQEFDTHCPVPEDSFNAIEAVRQRPRMYIGDVEIPGLHYLFKEILENAVGEVLAGDCDQVTVTLSKDRSITVADNGRSIPTATDSQTGRPIVEATMTDLHAGWFLNHDYQTARRLYNVGAACINAVSEWMETTVREEGKVYRLRFARGIVVSPLEAVGDCGPEEHGTTQRWLADRSIFTGALTEAGELDYRSELLLGRVRETAFLTKEVSITFHDDLHDAEPVVLHYPNGVAAYVAFLNDGKNVLHDTVIYARQQAADVVVEVAAQYSRSDEVRIDAFANNMPQWKGGTHVTGFKTALTRAVNRYARKHGFLREADANFSGKDVRAGMTAVISVRLPAPRFRASTYRLFNPELKGIVGSVFGTTLAAFLEANPEAARAIVDKVAGTAQARAARCVSRN